MNNKKTARIKVWIALLMIAVFATGTSLSAVTTPVISVQAAQSMMVSKTSSMILAIGTTKKADVTLDSNAVTYKSNNERIATVNAKGIVTGIARGKTVITASTKTQEVRINVTVYEQRLSAGKTELIIEQNTKLEVTLARRHASEELAVTVENNEILEVKTGTWNKTSCPLTLIPKKNGTTTITVHRPKSVEPLLITVTVSLKQELKATEIYALCEPSMVEFSVKTLDGEDVTGSGFFVGNGQILTNYHVISNAKEITVKDYDGKEYQVTGYYGYNKEIDIALLKVTGTKPALTISYADLVIGDTIYTIGSPYGFTGSFSKGILSYLNRTVENYEAKYIQHTAAISKGNSGGPLINRFGEVIGINTLTYTTGQNLNFSLPTIYYTSLSQQELKPISQFYEEMVNGQ